MKKAYDAYSRAGKSKDEQMIQSICERARQCNMPLLQNPALVQTLLSPLGEQMYEKELFLRLEGLLEWIELSEQKAQMS